MKRDNPTRRTAAALTSACIVASALYADPSTPATTPGEPPILSLSGQLRLEYEPRAGRITLLGKDGRALLANATAAVAAADATILATDARFDRTHSTDTSDDPLLPGPSLRVRCKDRQGKLDLEWRITVLTDRPGAVFELIVANPSTDPVQLRHTEPLRLLANESAGCGFGADGATSRVRKALTNGRLYYDPGQLFDFTPDGPGELYSTCNIAFFAPDTRETFVVGYLENRDAEGTLMAGWLPSGQDATARVRFNLVARSHYNDYFVVPPGATVSSGRLLVLRSQDAHTGLEDYAQLSGRLHNVRLNPVINGWCSWFVTYGNVTEEEVLRHAEFIARELKSYGMEWVQIDDGYQRAFGDWEGNSRFPHGMKGLADRIRELGLRPGIWLAPYAISAQAAVAREHPEWLAHDSAGQLQPIVPEHQQQAQYILDVTHPQARQWLSDLFRTVSRDWGYDFIKTDFVEWTILATGRYHDPSVSKAQAYRLGCQVMREAMGPDRHLLDCGPAPMAVGLIDSMRIQLDRPSPPCTVWEHYSGWYNSVIPAVAKRYYFHGNTWINDADHLRMRDLTIPQAQAAATILALSGGTMISGDRLYDLDAEQLAILRKVLPAGGESARPVDLFEKAQAETFVLPIVRPFDRWWLVGCFNGAADPVTRKLEFGRLGLDADRTFLAYEFWSSELLGEARGGIDVTLAPTSCKLLAIHERQGVPQIVGTDRHFTQGGIELAEVRWDAGTNTLTGTALGKPGMTWRLFAYLPPGYTWKEEEHSATNLSDVACDRSLLRARVSFHDTQRVDWSLRFQR